MMQQALLDDPAFFMWVIGTIVVVFIGSFAIYAWRHRHDDYIVRFGPHDKEDEQDGRARKAGL